MFFHISAQHQDNFSNHYDLGPLCVDTDSGWQQVSLNGHSLLFKGYADSASLPDLLTDIVNTDTPELLGNFCVLDWNHDTQQLHIRTDRYRSFPIYVQDQHSVTNLWTLDRTVWTDTVISVDRNINLHERQFDVIGLINDLELSEAEVLARIDQRLKTRTETFLKHNGLPVKTFLSGGVDSLLVYSYVKQHVQPELIACEHLDFDWFWLNNSGHLKKFWAYRQIHHWKEPCVLTSGAPGDELMLRSPTTSDYYLRWHGKSITDMLNSDAWQSCLHHSYFNKYQDLYTKPCPFSATNKQELIWQLCNIVINDWQHWHLGNTLTWTPLRDLEIFKLLLRLPLSSAVGQIMNSDISCRLIEQNSPGLTRAISDQKNTGNALKNLAWLLGESA